MLVLMSFITLFAPRPVSVLKSGINTLRARSANSASSPYFELSILYSTIPDWMSWLMNDGLVGVPVTADQSAARSVCPGRSCVFLCIMGVHDICCVTIHQFTC